MSLQRWGQVFGDLAAPGPIGASTPNTITGTIITATNKFLAPDGTFAAPAYSFAGRPDMGIYREGDKILIRGGKSGDTDLYTFGAFDIAGMLGVGDGLVVGGAAGAAFTLAAEVDGLHMADWLNIAWFSTDNLETGAVDLELNREGPGILAQGRRYDSAGSDGNVFRIYKLKNIFSGAYERLKVGTEGTQFVVAPEAGGTGVLRGLRLGVSGGQVGFYGANPVARAAAIAAPTAPSASYVQAEAQSMKTAVDAIRTALTNIGITL
jgi:hypothetical protein